MVGQTVLNMFYYMALGYAEKIYSVLGELGKEKSARQKALSVQKAVNTLLFDKERGILYN